MKIVAFDVGFSGAACCYERSGGDMFSISAAKGRVIDIIDMPTVGEGTKKTINVLALDRWIKAQTPDQAIIEQSWSRPDDGAMQAFRFGRSYGSVEATVALTQIPYMIVAPQSWKARFGLKGPDKEQDRQCALRTIPSAAKFLELKKHHNRADALLIAVFCSEKLIAQMQAA